MLIGMHHSYTSYLLLPHEHGVDNVGLASQRTYSSRHELVSILRLSIVSICAVEPFTDSSQGRVSSVGCD